MDDNDIFSAVESGDFETLKSFLNEGKDYSIKNNFGEWSLIHYVAHAGNFQCVNLILERAKLDYESPTEIVENLLKLSPSDSKWQTPLALAVMHGHTRVVELLANVYKTSGVKYENMGDLLRLACHQDQNKCIEILVKIIPQSVNRVMDDTKQKYGPMHITIQEGNVEGTKILLENGCDVNMKCRSNQTPLHAAVYCNNFDIVKLIADKVDDINACDINDYTPLFLATERGNDEIVQCLLDNGADETKIYGGKRKPAVIHAALHGKNDRLKELFREGYPTFDSDTELFRKNVLISILKNCPSDALPEIVEILLDNETPFHSLTKLIDGRIYGDEIGTDIYFLTRTFATTDHEVLTQFLAAGILELRFDCKTFPDTSSIIKRHRKFSNHRNSVRNVPGILSCLEYFPFLSWSYMDSSVLPTSDNFRLGHLDHSVPSLLNLMRWTIRCLVIKNKGMIHQKYLEDLKLPKKIIKFLAKL